MEPAQFLCNGVMTKAWHCLGHEFINQYLSAAAGLPDYLLGERNRRGPGELRVDVEQKTVVFHSTGDVQFANAVGLQS